MTDKLPSSRRELVRQSRTRSNPRALRWWRLIWTSTRHHPGRGIIRDEASSGVVTLRHDVPSEQSWHDAARAIKERFDRLDILVNNAGISNTGPLDALTLTDWRVVYAVNVEGVFLGIKMLLLLVPAGSHKRGGTVDRQYVILRRLARVAVQRLLHRKQRAVSLLTKSAVREYGAL